MATFPLASAMIKIKSHARQCNDTTECRCRGEIAIERLKEATKLIRGVRCFLDLCFGDSHHSEVPTCVSSTSMSSILPNPHYHASA